MMADPLATWSSFLASPHAPGTAMSALELDGYLTGIVVTPKEAPLRPSVWMARIWGDDEPIFEDETQIETALGAAALHYNTILSDIDRSLERLKADRILEYRPLFLSGEEKPAHDTVRTWVRGFWKAMKLAPETWRKLVEDERTKIMMQPFVGFFEFGGPALEEIPANIDDMLDEDGARIPYMILALRRLTQIREATSDPVQPRRRTKVGRNEPCPCGSGRKYKRCCGAG